MKFTGQQVTLRATPDNLVITMRNKTDTVQLVLTEMEGAQLMSFLMTTYGLMEVTDEDFEPVEQDKKVH